MVPYRRLMRLAGILWALTLLLASTMLPTPPEVSPVRAASSAADLPTSDLRQSVPDRSIFGVETNTGRIDDPIIEQQATDLGASWVRLNTVSWRSVQPDADTPPSEWNWAALETFESELAAAARANLTPMVVVDDSPHWAIIDRPEGLREELEWPTSCAAIRTERFDDYARFLGELVSRYKEPPYNVRYWELGNEVDIDPNLLSTPDNIFGCWGDATDDYYGGEHYGEMLKAVNPAIKAADPNAQVLIGGLLLDRPETFIVGRGKPERFFEGILRAGAGGSFDIVAFHAYPWYRTLGTDSDLTDSRWAERGGMTIGKVRFLREVMGRYGIDKPLMLNEGALLSNSHSTNFFEEQANHIVRVSLRALSEGVEAFCWYTLHDSGWLSAGLLDRDGQPRPGYGSYRELITQVGSTPTAPTSFYGAAVEAYRFDKGTRLVDVLWARATQPTVVEVPRMAFLAAYTRDGAALEPEMTTTSAQLTVSHEPIYIHSLPLPDGVVPQVSSAEPAEALNAEPVRISIDGANFVAGSTVWLDDLPLSDVSLSSSTRLEATVPADLPIGTYDLLVISPDSWSGRLPNAFTVRSSSPPLLSRVSPPYGAAGLANRLHIVGANFTPTMSATLGTQNLPVRYVESTHIYVDIPAGVFAPGTYDLQVVNPDQSSTLLEAAYTLVSDQGVTFDLQGNAYDLWTEPATPRAGTTARVGHVVYRAGPAQEAFTTTVRFYLETSNRERIDLGRSPLTIPAGAGSARTTGLEWTVPVSGNYTLFAVADPENTIVETDELNNTASRALTVLAADLDPTAPQITGVAVVPDEQSLAVDGTVLGTTSQQVQLVISATDEITSTGARSGVASIYFAEYDYHQGAGQWLPVQQARGWQDYRPAQFYDWQLVPTPGMKYLQAWVADQAGNISPAARVLVNYLPPTGAEVVQSQTDTYRYALSTDDRLTVRLEAVSSTLDLYAWSANPDDQEQLSTSDRVTRTFELPLVAAADGIYQVEIDGFAPGGYRFTTVTGAQVQQGRAIQQADDPYGIYDPPRTAPAAPLQTVPDPWLALPAPPATATEVEEEEEEEKVVYLSLIMR